MDKKGRKEIVEVLKNAGIIDQYGMSGRVIPDNENTEDDEDVRFVSIEHRTYDSVVLNALAKAGLLASDSGVRSDSSRPFLRYLSTSNRVVAPGYLDVRVSELTFEDLNVSQTQEANQ